VDKSRRVLTTGQVAKICKVAPRTVSKWFDSGQLRGYRIPGSRDRRIPFEQLIRFMKVYGIPLDELETGQTRVLIVDPETDLTGLIQRALVETGYYEVRVAESAFEAGALVEQFQPTVLLVDVDLPGVNGRTLPRYLSSHPELAGTQLIAMSGSLTPADRQMLLQQGFHNTIAKPFDIPQLTETIENTMGVMV
jgi:excisionase family DNA binding protein